MKFKPLSWLMLALIAFYRTCISPLLPPACRYTPTCSQYAQEAIRKYGPFKGGWLALTLYPNLYFCADIYCSSRRWTYLPKTSNSMLTTVPGRKLWKFVTL